MSKGKQLEILGRLISQERTHRKGKEQIDMIIADENEAEYYVQARPNTFDQVEDLQPESRRVFFVSNELSKFKANESKRTLYFNNLILQKIY